MLSIFSITFPFFALVVCGYVAVRRAILPQSAIPGLNSFVLYFALPCLLYRFGSTTPLTRLLDPGVFGVYLLCALCMVGLTLAFSRRRGLDWNNAAFGALVAAFPNTGFMGVPLLVALLGPASSGPVIVTLVVDLVITSSLCIALSRLGHPGAQGSATGIRHSLRHTLPHTLRGIAGNPMPWAIALGALASGAGLLLPKPLMQTIALLADAASPVALFTIGAVLARAQSQAQAAPLGDIVPVALAKLLLHPLLIGAVGHSAIALGVPLDPAALTVLVLVACLPSASNVALLSERFKADTGRVARIILVSTALSFVSFGAAVFMLAGTRQEPAVRPIPLAAGARSGRGHDHVLSRAAIDDASIIGASAAQSAATAAWSAGGRFWLSFHLPCRRSSGTSMPTIAFSKVSTKAGGASPTDHGAARANSWRAVRRSSSASVHAGSSTARSTPWAWTTA
jgi:malonate transporter